MRLPPVTRPPGAANRAAGPEKERRACLHGELDQIGLPTLLTVLDMERVSGVIVIQRSAQTGCLWLRGGRVVRATIEGAARLGGKLAVCDMLAWGEGRFDLTREEIDGPDEIKTATTHLLMEAARRADEAGAVLLF